MCLTPLVLMRTVKLAVSRLNLEVHYHFTFINLQKFYYHTFGLISCRCKTQRTREGWSSRFEHVLFSVFERETLIARTQAAAFRLRHGSCSLTGNQIFIDMFIFRHSLGKCQRINFWFLILSWMLTETVIIVLYFSIVVIISTYKNITLHCTIKVG